MPVSPYFNNYSDKKINEQVLFEDLIVESIKIMGHDVFYLPREKWEDRDPLFGENLNSRFKKAYQIEMYLNTPEQFGGQGDFFSKFGLDIQDQSNFVVSRRSFMKYIPSSVTERPREGDLLFIPVFNDVYEIKFVEQDAMFFTAGKRLPYVYELKCEKFRFNNEVLETGIPEVDDIDPESEYTIQIIAPGIGDFYKGEIVYQGANVAYATMTGRVSSWDSANSKLYVSDTMGIVNTAGSISGVDSGTSHGITDLDNYGNYIKYDSSDNKQIQDEANNVVIPDLNPFGYP